MATKIRLQRFGKKGRPFYHVVVADARSPRDGKFIERLGSYDPNSNPATIDINFDKALDWVTKGAQPTDTCRAILSYKGVMYKKHLAGGIRKGALTQEQADAKFEEWLKSKESKIENKKEGLSSSKEEARKAALAAEAKKKEEKAAAVIAKNTPPAEEELPEAAENQEGVEESAAETVEAPAAENTQEEVEAPEANTEAEVPVAEGTEEFAEADEVAPIAESKEEAGDTIEPDGSKELENASPAESADEIADTQAANEEEEENK
jgi:small subunit ribosomal protein S16